MDSIADADDSLADWIANAGIRVSRICTTVIAQAVEKGGHLAEFKAAREGGDILSNAYQNPNTARPTAMNPRITTNPTGLRLTLGTLVLELNPSLGSGSVATLAAAVVETTTTDGGGPAETFKEPFVDGD